MRTTTHSKGRKNSRKRAKNRFGLFLALCAGSLISLICIILLLPAAFRDTGTADKPSTMAVKTITVEGNTRYDEEAILGVSGIKVGQSVFSVDKRKAEKALKKTFHYIEDVAVRVDFSRNVKIQITEAQPMGAVYAEGNWVVVSEKGMGLQVSPVTTERPLRQLYIKGAGVLCAEEGKQVLDEESSELVAEIFAALNASKLTDISVVDIADRTDIRLNWKNQITILLGNDSNLEYEIAAAVSALPTILDKHGETATGHLNLSQYSDPTVQSPSIIFTPSSLLD